MNKINIKISKKIVIKKIFQSLFFIFVFFLLSLLFSYIFPEEELISKNIRLPLQKKVMASIGDYTIHNQQIIKYINEDNLIIDGKNNISLVDLEKYLSELKTGDIIFTNSGKYLSSIFIPGKWKHSAVYIGNKNQLSELLTENSKMFKDLEIYYQNNEQKLVIDSSSNGVQIRDIKELSNLSQSSYLKSFTVFRINKNKEKIIDFLKKSKEQIGKEYDYDLITEDEKELYCSELIYHSLNEIGFKIKKEESFAREMVSPNDLVNYMALNKYFSFIVFLEKENYSIKELNKLELLKKISAY